MNDLWVTSVLITPLIGLIPILLWPKAREHQIKWIALLFTLATFGVSLLLLFQFDTSTGAMQHEHLVEWLNFGTFKINYDVAVDGMSILLVMLTTFIMPLAILFSLTHITDRVRLYYAFMLLVEFAMIGVFVAQDLFLFYIFWEVSLIPMYFLIGIWGGQQRVYAAVKFFLYTMAGSLLMLLAILWMGTHFGTFSVHEIITRVQAAAATPENVYGRRLIEAVLFLGFFIAFAIKVPIWPLHSWLPDAHTEAPTAGSVILAGVMLKLGTYGLLRFCLGFFPWASVYFAPFIAVLAIIGIIFGAWVSYAQTDVKKLVAYSSISHLGFVVLGIFALGPGHAAGVSGATLQMVNHGISTGGLFLLVGMLYERRHTRAINAFGGVWKVMPIFSGLSLVIVLSSMGLPGLNGFIGEFTILLGTFGSTVLGPIFAALACLGVILAAIYLLYMWNTVFMGEYKAPTEAAHAAPGHEEVHAANPYPPLTWNEAAALVVVVIAAITIGLFPRPFFGTMDKSAGDIQAQLQRYIPASGAAVAQAPTPAQK
ncbi:MAG TPA: NADH-quinone oxidoreductase subunit M [Aggregatilineales bacterium]|nr:NADH-quinone oxidoreductase subunit M [Aggregatilineales bacterium]